MPMEPRIYNKFKDIRYQSFFGLAGLIQPAEKISEKDCEAFPNLLTIYAFKRILLYGTK